MALTDEQIAKLLTVPDKAPAKRKRKAGPDFSQIETRTHENWFMLAHKIFDEETQELMRCGNPNCSDIRTSGAVVAHIDIQHPTAGDEETAIVTYKMCRYCFMDGYGIN